MKKMLLCMFLALGVSAVGSPVFADTGSAIASVEAGSAATPAPPPTAGSDAASQLHDPLKDPGATISDLKIAKKAGWGLALFAGLVIVCRLLGRAKSLPKLAFLGQGKTAAIVGAIGAMAVAGYDSLANGGSWAAVLVILFGAGLHYFDATPAPKPTGT